MLGSDTEMVPGKFWGKSDILKGIFGGFLVAIFYFLHATILVPDEWQTYS